MKCSFVGEPLPIPKVKTFTKLDESLMDKIYKKIKDTNKPISHTDLFNLGWTLRSENESYRERQALLALENLGLIKRITDNFSTDFGKRFHDEEWALQIRNVSNERKTS